MWVIDVSGCYRYVNYELNLTFEIIKNTILLKHWQNSAWNYTIKIIHPGVENGTLESETLNALRRHEENVHRQNKKTDPRWDKLKDLI